MYTSINRLLNLQPRVTLELGGNPLRYGYKTETYSSSKITWLWESQSIPIVTLSKLFYNPDTRSGVHLILLNSKANQFFKIKDIPIVTYINSHSRTRISTTWESSSIWLHEEVVAPIMNWDTTEWKSNHRSLILHNQLRHWGSLQVYLTLIPLQERS